MGLKEELTELVESLYSFRDYYYLKAPNRAELEEMEASKAEMQKQRDLQGRLADVLKSLEASKDKLCVSKQDTAYFELLRGKALNVLSDFDENAQQALERAVKCDPELTDAWNQLGECFWKRGDLQQARNCFETALERRRTKESLRALSMLLRQVRATPKTGGESQRALVERSIEFAKEAVSLDVRDGASWNCLATALIAQFFSFGSQNAALIQRALGAYANAVRDVRVQETAVEMHVNRAVALHYADRYGEALDALSYAMRIDPHFQAAATRFAEERAVLRDARRSLLERGGIKKKRFEQLVATIDESGTINGLRLQVHRNAPPAAQPAEPAEVASPPAPSLQPQLYSVGQNQPSGLDTSGAFAPASTPQLFSVAQQTPTPSLGLGLTQQQIYSVAGATGTAQSNTFTNLTPTVTDVPPPAPKATKELVDVNPARVQDLIDGCNAEKALYCVALATIRQPNGVPLTVCVADRSGACALVNVYNVDTRRRTVSVGDRLVVLEPVAKRVRVSERLFDEQKSADSGKTPEPPADDNETMFEFTLVRVSSPLSLLVNGKPLEASSIAETEFRIEAQP